MSRFSGVDALQNTDLTLYYQLQEFHEELNQEGALPSDRDQIAFLDVVETLSSNGRLDILWRAFPELCGPYDSATASGTLITLVDAFQQYAKPRTISLEQDLQARGLYQAQMIRGVFWLRSMLEGERYPDRYAKMIEWYRQGLRMFGLGEQYLGRYAAIHDDGSRIGSGPAGGISGGKKGKGGDTGDFGYEGFDIHPDAQPQEITESETGFRNAGNTCYLNATLQLILQSTTGMTGIRDSNEVFFAEEPDGADVPETLIARVLLSVAQTDYKAALNSYNTLCLWLSALPRTNPWAEFSPMRAMQHDANEFLLFRLSHCSRLDPLLTMAFGHRLRLTYECLSCGHALSQENPNSILNVNMFPQSPTSESPTIGTMQLGELLVADYMMPRSELLTCHACGVADSPQLAYSIFQPETGTRDVIVAIKRWKELSFGIWNKDQRLVKFPKHPFAVPAFNTRPDEESFWFVKAVMHHKGSGRDSGHWYTDAREDWNKPWTRYNDSRQYPVEFNEVEAKTAVTLVLSAWRPTTAPLPSNMQASTLRATIHIQLKRLDSAADLPSKLTQAIANELQEIAEGLGSSIPMDAAEEARRKERKDRAAAEREARGEERAGGGALQMEMDVDMPAEPRVRRAGVRRWLDGSFRRVTRPGEVPLVGPREHLELRDDRWRNLLEQYGADAFYQLFKAGDFKFQWRRINDFYEPTHLLHVFQRIVNHVVQVDTRTELRRVADELARAIRRHYIPVIARRALDSGQTPLGRLFPGDYLRIVTNNGLLGRAIDTNEDERRERFSQTANGPVIRVRPRARSLPRGLRIHDFATAPPASLSTARTTLDAGRGPWYVLDSDGNFRLQANEVAQEQDDGHDAAGQGDLDAMDIDHRPLSGELPSLPSDRDWYLLYNRKARPSTPSIGDALSREALSQYSTPGLLPTRPPPFDGRITPLDLFFAETIAKQQTIPSASPPLPPSSPPLLGEEHPRPRSAQHDSSGPHLPPPPRVPTPTIHFDSDRFPASSDPPMHLPPRLQARYDRQLAEYKAHIEREAARSEAGRRADREEFERRDEELRLHNEEQSRMINDLRRENAALRDQRAAEERRHPSPQEAADKRRTPADVFKAVRKSKTLGEGVKEGRQGLRDIFRQNKSWVPPTSDPDVPSEPRTWDRYREEGRSSAASHHTLPTRPRGRSEGTVSLHPTEARDASGRDSAASDHPDSRDTSSHGRRDTARPPVPVIPHHFRRDPDAAARPDRTPTTDIAPETRTVPEIAETQFSDNPDWPLRPVAPDPDTIVVGPRGGTGTTETTDARVGTAIGGPVAAGARSTTGRFRITGEVVDSSSGGAELSSDEAPAPAPGAAEAGAESSDPDPIPLGRGRRGGRGRGDGHSGRVRFDESR